MPEHARIKKKKKWNAAKNTWFLHSHNTFSHVNCRGKQWEQSWLDERRRKALRINSLFTFIIFGWGKMETNLVNLVDVQRRAWTASAATNFPYVWLSGWNMWITRVRTRQCERVHAQTRCLRPATPDHLLLQQGSTDPSKLDLKAAL